MQVQANCVLVTCPALKNYRSDTPHLITRTTVDALARANLIPVIVGPDMDKRMALRLYEQCAGIVCTGGNDWNPALYNQSPAPETDTPEDDRDEIELALLTKALLNKKPVVGICRGMQGLAIALYRMHPRRVCASIIIQEVSRITKQQHNTTYDGMTLNKHKITISQDTIAHEVFRNTAIMMPKGNHQAVDGTIVCELPGVKVSGKSSVDNMTEVIELKRTAHPFCIATQGHPEVDQGLSMLLFNRLSYEMKRFANTSNVRLPIAVDHTSAMAAKPVIAK